VHAQIIGELAVVTTAAIAVAVLLVAQVRLLPVPRDILVSRGVFVVSLLVACAIIYCITLACAWYPSHMATRTEPAEALRYE
jgi:putative ABC transport system permease protein